MPHSELDNFFREYSEHLCCPRCGSETLGIQADGFNCRLCQRHYPVQDGIPSLFMPNEWDDSKEDVTEKIKAFYEENPFPNYDDFDNVGSLIDKARKAVFAKLLDDQIPYRARVIECGCGTGQLTNFLAIRRTVIGTDLCLNSLKMATAFKQQNDLKRAHFLQMNLFRPAFKPGTFDLVISNGVLHHTSDPQLGFESISRLVRPGGYIMIGLYHKYGRLATDIRRVAFNATNDRFMFLDRHAVDAYVSTQKRRSWFMDQYKNPHESKHTVGEVIGWLEKIGFEFVHAIPKTEPFKVMTEDELLFKPERLGSGFERMLVNLGMIISGHREGGFFIVIARRPVDPNEP
ncbi:methyltransferase domain-containing protein [Mycobacterium sp. GA-1285]|uniref:methyltransferase domain-containing protein n=1 Tax=Mycobacterium sp. GA-1285 TaxID=1772282 RepID=UPI000AC065CE|nr:methyltransferase domain-containing protein [Mycobacterium sp. GA-1285]